MGFYFISKRHMYFNFIPIASLHVALFSTEKWETIKNYCN